MGRLKRRLAGLLCLALVCLGAPVARAQAEPAPMRALLSQIPAQPVLGSGSFTYADNTFYRLVLPPGLRAGTDSAFCLRPGDSDERIREIKLALNSDARYPHNEFVTYTQVRSGEPVASYFDGHLATLIETLYLFCGLEGREPVIDELTCALLDALPETSEAMRHDIERVYKYKLTESGTQGTVARSGQLDGLYYFAQTDPDWADEIFEFEGNGATLRDRGCGTACAAMVFSTYHKVEITPKWMRHYALEGDWPVSYGLPNEYFEGIARIYANLEAERYHTVLKAPQIIPKEQLDLQTLQTQIGEQGYLAIIHVVAGAFTSQEHYMVLEDYRVIDGVGYFLVADPYILPSRYRDWDQLKTTDTGNDGLIYATADVLYRDCKSVILFAQDRNSFPLFSECGAAEILRAPEAS